MAFEAIRKSDGKIIEVTRCGPQTYIWADKNHKLYNRSDLDFDLDNRHPEATISGWVARDKGGGLYLHSVRPRKGVAEWHSNHQPTPLPLDSFPSLTWQDDPIEVEITIKPKDNAYKS